MLQLDDQASIIEGPKGALPVQPDDVVTRRLAMLLEGECAGIGPTRAARKFGLSKQRYHQIRDAFRDGGALALRPQKRGPKTNYRRTDEVVRQVIRYRFLDPDATVEVIAQKLRQTGFEISARSVGRVIHDFGLQKKTPRGPA